MVNIVFFLTAALSAREPVFGVEDARQGPTETFRFHSLLEPTTIDPRSWQEAGGGFMNFNLFRTLYQIGPSNELEPDLAESCVWRNSEHKILRCRLRPNLETSRGHPLKALDFILAWRRMLLRENLSPHAELFTNVEGVSSYLKGLVDINKIGFLDLDERTIEIRLKSPNSEFLWNLALPVTTPSFAEQSDFTDPSKIHFTGPYQVESWTKKTRITLIPNPKYWQKSNRPKVEILFVDDDSAAMSLFELGKIDFLRRVNFKDLPRFQGQSGFKLSKMARFDIVGLGGFLGDQPHFREALVRALDYQGLTKLLNLPTQLGCPSTFREWSKIYPCHRFDLARARTALKRVSPEILKKKLVLGYSKLAGEDVARSMEWMQNQWQQNLGLLVELRPMDSKLLMAQVQANQHALFHRGVNLTRPTCAAALELFSDSSNFGLPPFKNRGFSRLTQRLLRSNSKPLKLSLCGKALKILMDEALFIPLGEVHFASIQNDQFKGLRLTPINQLDLSQLEFSQK